ncbi:MAG: serine--tRNA ligase [Alphaproteobacteria bacterium]|nr:serine--tRNA ligase [Alphaproteobacteria bacterium]
MHDIKSIRENPQGFDAGLAKRGLEPLSAKILALDADKRGGQTRQQELQAKSNEIAKAIGLAKRNGEDATALFEDAKRVKQELAALAAGEEDGGELGQMLATIPNLPADDVPQGKDETGNVEKRVVGKKPTLNFAAAQHFEIGEKLGLMDFEQAGVVSGARFVYLKGMLARMERALASFMLDLHTQEFGYTEVAPPLLVRDNALYGTGQLPKFSEDLFKTTTDHWLIPTAEVSLTNLVADKILSDTELPLRLTAWTPCFRSEAGSAGRDTRGMIRQHQFSKVELVSIVHPDKSNEEHERMTAAAEEVLKRLGLHYRVMALCTGDMGFSARKTYDLEVWLPGQDAFREISSCSNCGDFQARRMKARFKAEGDKQTRFVHTLNGSGLAVGRTLVAVLENYQQADGSIAIPDALRPYMGNVQKVELAA